MAGLKNISFDAWVEHSFGHEVPLHGPAWHFDLDSVLWQGEPAETVAHITRLFEDPEPALAYFSDAQIAQGLDYIINNAAGDLLASIREPALPLEARLRCARSISTVYDRLFAPRCTPHLSHLNKGDMAVGPLNGVCYMWWDTVPGLATPDDPNHKAMDDAMLDVMRHALTLDSIACQESALHGLGHWAFHHKAAVAPIVDAYLKARPGLSPELIAYAKAAKSGCVL
ncbi:MAG: hypothetical protein FJX66_05450 [Alphaproteobacteria bacterium]|nr:hypothetical protein [Alphaproteobacteria bacterium]